MNKLLTKKNIPLIIVICIIFTFCITPLTAYAAEIYYPSDISVFDADYYAQQNPDVVVTCGEDKNALLKHYITFGKFEGRKPYEDYTPSNNAKTAEYNVLFIGNSITMHPVCDYWWGDWGMAASSPEKDYVHQLISGLQTKYESVDYDIISYSVWERDYTRTNILPNIDYVLENEYDLVVIQLGENSHNLETFESDYATLVQYIKKSVPSAKIVLVGDFWMEHGRDDMKLRVAMQEATTYIDISKIRKNKKYSSSVGTVVYGADGKKHSIEYPIIAEHPNDLGMQSIAKEILQSIDTIND